MGTRTDVRTAPTSFDRVAGIAAIAVGVGGLLYSILFVVLLNRATKAAATGSDLLLIVGGILTIGVMVALYQRLKLVDQGFALWALLLGVLGSAGSITHGGYDLGIIAHTPTSPRGDLPNPTDPRGLMTFALTALALLIVSWLILRGGVFPNGLAWVGIAAGDLLVVVYVGRLVVFNPKSPGLLVAAVLVGFVLNPLWFVWLGLELRKTPVSVGP